jgi:hypothetical protein
MNPSKIKGSFVISRKQRRDYEWPLWNATPEKSMLLELQAKKT